MRNVFRSNRLRPILLALSAVAIGGCAGATVNRTQRADHALPKPDMIIVNDFAIADSEVKLDRGLMASSVRDAGARTSTEEEKRIGHTVAQKLSEDLVEELRKVGISAARGGHAVAASPTTCILNGEFVTIDQGNQSHRVWVGFGLGGSELRTRVQVLQNNAIVAQAETVTESGLKPGMLLSLGAGAAAESGAAVVAGATVTGVSEAFFATVEADARRTAQQIAEKLKDAYVARGWLPE